MKIKTQPRDDHQVTLIVTLEKDQMEGAKHRAARRISEKKSIPGFRPGKAPYDVVVRNFGESYIVEAAVDLLLDEIYPKALEESKVEPAASGSLEKMDDLDKEPKFTFTVPLAPSVELGDYRSIRLPYEWQEPTDGQVDKSLQDLRRMYAKTETVERPVETGDFVMIDLKGVKAKAEEGEAPAFERPGMPVFVREEKDQKEEEYPYPGFSKELVGMSANESKSFSHKFPKGYKDESLQGQIVKLDVTVKMVRGSQLPDLNDEFAKTVGAFENLEALRGAMKANLEMQSKNEYDDLYFDQLIAEIKKGAAIKYAPQTLEHELEHITEDIEARLARQGLDMTAYLKSREMDEAKFKEEEAKPAAARRLETSLLMDEIGKIEKIEVSETTLKASFQQILGEYQGDASFQKMMRGKTQLPKHLMDMLAMESANRAYGQLTLERLKAIATGQAPELPAEEEKAPKSPKKRTSSPKSGTAKTGKSKTETTRKKAAKSEQKTESTEA